MPPLGLFIFKPFALFRRALPAFAFEYFPKYAVRPDIKPVMTVQHPPSEPSSPTDSAEFQAIEIMHLRYDIPANGVEFERLAENGDVIDHMGASFQHFGFEPILVFGENIFFAQEQHPLTDHQKEPIFGLRIKSAVQATPGPEQLII